MDDRLYSEVLSGAPFLRETVAKFVATLPSRILELENALAQATQEDLRVVAHRLKGAGGTHGYPMLSDLARTLEEAAKDNDLARAKALIAELKALVARVVPEAPPT